jgi:hypothetical protein
MGAIETDACNPGDPVGKLNIDMAVLASALVGDEINLGDWVSKGGDTAADAGPGPASRLLQGFHVDFGQQSA